MHLSLMHSHLELIQRNVVTVHAMIVHLSCEGTHIMMTETIRTWTNFLKAQGSNLILLGVLLEMQCEFRGIYGPKFAFSTMIVRPPGREFAILQAAWILSYLRRRCSRRRRFLFRLVHLIRRWEYRRFCNCLFWLHRHRLRCCPRGLIWTLDDQVQFRVGIQGRLIN